jgi:general secretion pathway protein M
MNASLRSSLSLLGVAAVVALGLGGAVSVALSLSAERADLAALSEQSQALQAREKRRPAPRGVDVAASASFEAASITLAGAALQSRVAAAVAGAKGRLISSRVDVESLAAERRIALTAELTIAEAEMQALLFDLETGRPYLFVDAFEARTSQAAGEGDALRVSLSLSGLWSAPK